jgi:transcriptional regulator with XRE-family HTH domain
MVAYESRQGQLRARGSRLARSQADEIRPARTSAGQPGRAETQVEELVRSRAPSGEPGQARVPASALCRRREELGKFLKARRARLVPAEFGIPAGSRPRRTPGLRREELASLAGVGVTWYTWLEQGREINASVQVLDALARTLRLDRAEREHLYWLAEASPLLTGTARRPIPAEVREIVASLDPLPASLTNGRFDILLSNDASEDLFWNWHEMPCIHKNTLWCCITEPSAREKFPEYEQEIPYLVARLRAAYARHVGDPDWEEDIRRLASLSEEFAGLWARHEVADPEPRVRTFIHPKAGAVTFSVTELEIPVLPEARLTVYTPADEQTRARLPLTRRAR